MIDHLGFSVSDMTKSKAFYVKALEPLGVTVVMEVTAEQTGHGAGLGMGRDGKPYFWIGDGRPSASGVHVAFPTETRAAVDAFYAAALAVGGRDNGPPGPRPEYHDNYYAAFVLDPDGNNIEAVCHQPQ
jgi:catechol 2,3-dioxygenase-like lactoylglutathione lyase family enzyme